MHKHSTDYDHFTDHIERQMTPVILLEGTRIVPSSAEATQTALGRFLARQFPHAHFRFGNAEDPTPCLPEVWSQPIRLGWNLSFPLPDTAGKIDILPTL